MKKCTILLMMLISALLSNNSSAQWKYVGKINFPATDNFVQPFLCTVDDNGKLYVISSRSTNLNAHDAIYYLDNLQDTLMTRMIDYTANGDTVNVNMLVGITHIKNDILVSAKINKYLAPGGQCCAYDYTNGDTSLGTRYGYNPYLAGWGTYVLGITATKDSIVIGGADFTKGVRFYNFSQNTKLSAFAAYMSPDNTNAEPGGPSTAGFDVIRDVAVIPNGDYFDPQTPFYTSRNSSSTGILNGGIALWSGGTQFNKSDSSKNHQNYVPLRVTDQDDFLKLNSSIPYGIACDNQGLLWVSGIDSTRRWVKGFQVDPITGIATNVDELPSSTKVIGSDPNGAPMTGPSDVVFTPDGSIGYVIDAFAKCVYKFSNITDVKSEKVTPNDYQLKQNYPNPFNPATMISFSVPSSMQVKLVVSNMLGQEVVTLVNGLVAAGNHSVQFNAGNLPSGIYLYSLQAGSNVITNKMILLK